MKKSAIVDLLLVVALVALLLYYNVPKEKQPANVVMVSFLDLYGDNRANIEIWIKNLGEQTAYNISIFIRCRDQNGSLLFNGTIYPTQTFLRANETSTAFCSIYLDNATKVYYTIEIRWNGGVNIEYKEAYVPIEVVRI